MSIPVPATSIAMGIRYEPQWAVSDRKGAVIDRILRSSGTPFGPSVFPGIVTTSPVVPSTRESPVSLAFGSQCGQQPQAR